MDLVQVLGTSEWTSIGSFVVATLAALFTGWQGFEARKARKASAESNAEQKVNVKMSAEAALRSAVAAEESATTSRQTMVLDARAWVLLAEVRRAGPTLHPIPAGAVLVLRNEGRTPALSLGCKTCYSPETEPPDYLGIALPDQCLTAIGPGHSTEIVYDLNEVVGLFNEIALGQRNLYIAGVAVYKDIFSHIHETRWCLRYDISQQGWVPARDYVVT